MKLKNITLGLLLSVLTLPGCQEPDDIVRNIDGTSASANTLTVKGRFADDETTEYVGTIDKSTGNIYIDVPYYMKDTEPIQADLTRMKLNASLPNSSKMTPSVAGIHDLSKEFPVRLTYEDGRTEDYRITARQIKSNKADITALTIPSISRLVTKITEEDGVNKIIIYKTSSTMMEALKTAVPVFTISPWATCSVEEGSAIDLSESKTITITAQNGTKKEYVTEIGIPEYVEPGAIGQITLLFGFQAVTTDPRGMEANLNRSLAVVGDELVIGNQNNSFTRLNRYTGALTDKTVNTSGMLTGGFTYAITSDDNGALVGVTMAAAKNQWSLNTLLKFYVWKNGLDAAPTEIMSKDIMTDASLASLIPDGGGYDIGRTLSVTGDILNGTAQIMVVSSAKQTVIRYKAVNGQIVNADSPQLIKVALTLGAASKAIPVTNDDDTPFILSSASSAKTHYYVQPDGTVITFAPKGNWWGSDTKGADYVEFNGLKLLGVQNGNYSNNVDAYNRLVVGNITSLSPSAFNETQIMDSRLQNFAGILKPDGTLDTQNATITGMTTFYISGGSTVGNNGNKTGDICFGKSSDGTAVQVYMMTTGHGIIAYEISKLKPL